MTKLDELIELLKFNKGEAMKKEKKNNIIRSSVSISAGEYKLYERRCKRNI